VQAAGDGRVPTVGRRSYADRGNSGKFLQGSLPPLRIGGRCNAGLFSKRSKDTAAGRAATVFSAADPITRRLSGFDENRVPLVSLAESHLAPCLRAPDHWQCIQCLGLCIQVLAAKARHTL
jgi:hypothetical protein